MLYLLSDPYFLIFGGAFLFWLLQGQIRGRYASPFKWIGERSRIRQLARDIKARPHDLTMLLDHGKMCVQHKKWKDAEASLLEVVDRRSESPEALYYLGRAQLGLKRMDQGLANIAAALELRGDLLYGEPQLVVGDHYLKAKNYSMAREAFESASDANASSSEAFYKLGLCLKALGEREAAKHAMEEAVTAHETVPRYKRRENRPWKWRAKFARV